MKANLVLLISLLACGRDSNASKAWNCSVNGVDCPKSTVVLVEGTPGPQGRDGRDGKNGVDGRAGVDGQPGERGETGLPGIPGQPGLDGQMGPRGEKGELGSPGTPGLDADLEIIDPCGDAPGIHDEVLVRLPDGSLLVSMSDQVSGKNTRFVILGPGDYQTTDGSQCRFSVDQELNVIF